MQITEDRGAKHNQTIRQMKWKQNKVNENECEGERGREKER